MIILEGLIGWFIKAMKHSHSHIQQFLSSPQRLLIHLQVNNDETKYWCMIQSCGSMSNFIIFTMLITYKYP